MLVLLEMLLLSLQLCIDVFIHEPFKQPELNDECRLGAYGGLLEKTELLSSADELYTVVRYGIKSIYVGIYS